MKVYWEKAEIGYVGSMLTPRIAERKCYSRNTVLRFGNEVSTTERYRVGLNFDNSRVSRKTPTRYRVVVLTSLLNCRAMAESDACRRRGP